MNTLIATVLLAFAGSAEGNQPADDPSALVSGESASQIHLLPSDPSAAAPEREWGWLANGMLAGTVVGTTLGMFVFDVFSPSFFLPALPIAIGGLAVGALLGSAAAIRSIPARLGVVLLDIAVCIIATGALLVLGAEAIVPVPVGGLIASPALRPRLRTGGLTFTF